MLLTMFGALTGCGSSSDESVSPPANGSGSGSIVLPLPTVSPKLPIPDNRTVNNFQVLMFGNSHVAANNLPGLVTRLLRTGRPHANVYATAAHGGGYLDERFQDSISLTVLQSRKWSHVILQGQKYSMSGLHSYSTSEAEMWIALSKNQLATPILFPEHARATNVEEGDRVYKLHQSIAAKEAACVAPVPQAWALAMEQIPHLELYVSDGNHANQNGSVLTAMLFYQIITGDPADQLPYIAELGVSAITQQLLRQQASAILQQHPACPF
jgi:hypothetical protein